jgi:hypothetical protein
MSPALVTTVIPFLASSPTLDELGLRGHLKMLDLHHVELGLKAGFKVLQRLDVGENEAGTNGLLMACKAGNLKLCECLLEAKADVLSRDKVNTSPLVAASGADVQQIREALIKAGADPRATRYDGASNLSLAIMSRKKRAIAVAIEALKLESEHWHGSRLCNGWGDSSADGSVADDMSAADVRQLALPYLQTSALTERLLHGASPLAIKGEIGVLLAALEAAGQNRDALSSRLDRARSFLDHHSALLQEPPVPIEQALAQLFAQEPAGVFERNGEGRPAAQGAVNTHIIGCVNQPSVTRPCRWTLEGRAEMRSVAYSSDGRRLARAEGNDVVIYCAVSGIELSRLLGHRLTCIVFVLVVAGCNGRLLCPVTPACVLCLPLQVATGAGCVQSPLRGRPGDPMPGTTPRSSVTLIACAGRHVLTLSPSLSTVDVNSPLLPVDTFSFCAGTRCFLWPSPLVAPSSRVVAETLSLEEETATSESGRWRPEHAIKS